MVAAMIAILHYTGGLAIVIEAIPGLSNQVIKTISSPAGVGCSFG